MGLFCICKLRMYTRDMLVLKPQDIVVLLKIVALAIAGDSWTQASLSRQLYLSPTEVHSSFKRLTASRLYDDTYQMVNISALQEILFHGIQYFFPAVRGTVTRGLPTASAAPPLIYSIQQAQLPPVWPWPSGLTRGYAIQPLYPTVPKAAAADFILYELLALVDAVRDSGPREKTIAIDELNKRLNHYSQLFVRG